MDWIEVFDTAIKIGLGAIIGGAFSIWSNKQNHENQIKKDILFDNRDTLKKAGTQFETIHVKVVSLYQELISKTENYIEDITAGALNIPNDLKERLLNNEIDVVKMDISELIELLKLPEPPNTYQQRRDVVYSITRELYILQGILMLYGYGWLSAIIYDYTTILGTVSQAQHQDSFKNILPEGEVFQKIQVLRNLYYQVANIYLKNSEASEKEIYRDIKSYLQEHKLIGV